MLNIIVLYLLKYIIIAITLLTKTKMSLQKATFISYAIFIPFILSVPYLIINSQFYWLLLPGTMLFFSILLMFLDFLSIYEDKSRYSEITGYDPKTKKISTLNAKDKQVDREGLPTSRKPSYCLVQMLLPFLPDRWVTLRKNALITGILSHTLDSLAFYLAGIAFIKSRNIHSFWGWRGFSTIIWAVGSYQVHSLTRDGGPSDLRKKPDKCAHNRIMTDPNRGILNFVVSFVAIVVGWQALIDLVPKGENLNNLKTVGIFLLPLYIIKYAIFSLEGILLITTSALGSLTNQINLAFQLTPGTSEEMDLPSCFD